VVTAACLAHKGSRVIGVDVNAAKVDALASGASPMVEPQVGELIAASHRAGRVHATTDPDVAVHESEGTFLCVGTPGLRNGGVDLSHLETVCRQIGTALRTKNGFHSIVLRSTVLPGTTETVVVPILEEASRKCAGSDFAVCVNPEFMREGTAVADFLNPAITVIGATDPSQSTLLRELYAWVPGRVFETSLRPAEMLKYACNAWHGLKVAFANEVGTLSKALGVEPATVLEVFTADTKLNISPSYLKPGFAFGGSCLPKDLRALSHRGRELDLHLPLLEAVLPSNQAHLQRAVDLILSTGKKKIAVLGLSFKSATDDLRESPHVQLVKRLLGEGCQVRIWDHNVSLGQLIGSNRRYIEETIPHIGSLLSGNLEEVVRGAELIVLGTREVSADTLRRYIHAEQVIVDLMNLAKDSRPTTSGIYKGICW